jgi:hypothetical protein
MRRANVLFAMIAMALGGIAEAAFDSAAAGDPVLNRIQSFFAEQRRADAATCTTIGRTDIDACVRELAKRRRAKLEAPVAPEPTGIDI